MIRTFIFLAAIVSPLVAEVKQPEPAPLPPPIAAPRDQAYAGPIQLTVDVTDVQRRIVKVHETVPVHGSELTLLYPEWIPGDHSPTGPIEDFAGLVVKANGKTIPWVRDRVEVYAFHIQIPAGVNSLDVDFQYLSPVENFRGPDFHGQGVAGPRVVEYGSLPGRLLLAKN